MAGATVMRVPARRYPLTMIAGRSSEEAGPSGATGGAVRLRLSDFPIPPSVRPDTTWTGQMHELADHIGPHATLLVCAALGGLRIYIPTGERGGDRRLASLERLRAVIGDEKAATFSRIYGGYDFVVPTARAALARARRAAVLAHVRGNTLAKSEAARILNSSRNYVAHLVNHTDEGRGLPPAPLPLPALVRAASLAADALREAGAAPAAIATLSARIARLVP